MLSGAKRAYRSFLFSAALLVPGIGLSAAPATPNTAQVAKKSVIPVGIPPPIESSFRPLNEMRGLLPFGRNIALADLNGDGKVDVVIAPTYFAWQPPLPIQIWLNEGDGTFRDSTSTVVEGPIPVTGLAGIFVRDFNGDGRPDVLFVDQGLEDKEIFDGGMNQILLSQPSGRLKDTSSTSFPGQVRWFNHTSSVGDINGDGSLDIVVTRLTGPSQSPGGIDVLLNDGRGVFQATSSRLPREIAFPIAMSDSVNYHHPGANTVVDLDGDGRLDLVTASYVGFDTVTKKRTVRVHQQLTDGSFVERHQYEIPSALRTIGYQPGVTFDGVNGFGLGASSIHSADLNGDGRNDLIVIWEGVGRSYIHLLRNDGGFNFTDVTLEWFGPHDVTFYAGNGSMPVMNLGLRDINGDGAPDLSQLHLGRVTVEGIRTGAGILLNDGNGKFTPWTWRVGGVELSPAQAAAALDFHGDPQSEAARHVGGTVMMGDVDGDGLDDLLVLDTLNENMTSGAFPRFQTSITLRAFKSTLIPQSSLSTAENVSGIWWNAGESGWGLNLSHQGSTLFGTLFTYGPDRSGIWLVMSSGARQADGSFSGALYQTTGPAFNASPFPPLGPGVGSVVQVGTMRLAFASKLRATLTYTVNGVAVTKDIVPQSFGGLQTCSNAASAPGARIGRTNYTDLWWVPSESGWGVNVTHQGNTLFATLFSYAPGTGNFNAGMWLVMSAGILQSDLSYRGDLYRTTGPAFNAQPFTPIGASDLTRVGSMQFRFENGERGTLIYDVGGQQVVKTIVPQVFGSQVATCTGG